MAIPHCIAYWDGSTWGLPDNPQKQYYACVYDENGNPIQIQPNYYCDTSDVYANQTGDYLISCKETQQITQKCPSTYLCKWVFDQGRWNLARICSDPSDPNPPDSPCICGGLFLPPSSGVSEITRTCAPEPYSYDPCNRRCLLRAGIEAIDADNYVFNWVEDALFGCPGNCVCEQYPSYVLNYPPESGRDVMESRCRSVENLGNKCNHAFCVKEWVPETNSWRVVDQCKIKGVYAADCPCPDIPPPSNPTQRITVKLRCYRGNIGDLKPTNTTTSTTTTRPPGCVSLWEWRGVTIGWVLIANCSDESGNPCGITPSPPATSGSYYYQKMWVNCESTTSTTTSSTQAPSSCSTCKCRWEWVPQTANSSEFEWVLIVDNCPACGSNCGCVKPDFAGAYPYIIYDAPCIDRSQTTTTSPIPTSSSTSSSTSSTIAPELTACSDCYCLAYNTGQQYYLIRNCQTPSGSPCYDCLCLATKIVPKSTQSGTIESLPCYQAITTTSLDPTKPCEQCSCAWICNGRTYELLYDCSVWGCQDCYCKRPLIPCTVSGQIALGSCDSNPQTGSNCSECRCHLRCYYGLWVTVNDCLSYGCADCVCDSPPVNINCDNRIVDAYVNCLSAGTSSSSTTTTTVNPCTGSCVLQKDRNSGIYITISPCDNSDCACYVVDTYIEPGKEYFPVIGKCLPKGPYACEGCACTWKWENGVWNLISGCNAQGCSAQCVCDPPSNPGQENGQIWITACYTAGTTMQPAENCNCRCIWICSNVGGNLQYVLHSNCQAAGCSTNCVCPQPNPITCVEEFSATETLCSTGSTTTTTTSTPSCSSCRCIWQWIDGDWRIYKTCKESSAECSSLTCGCQKPYWQGIEGEFGTTICDNSEPNYPCYGYCIWECLNGVWQLQKNCVSSNCYCNKPPDASCKVGYYRSVAVPCAEDILEIDKCDRCKCLWEWSGSNWVNIESCLDTGCSTRYTCTTPSFNGYPGQRVYTLCYPIS
ncbi:MAG: hypothetical protein KatS3mg087_0080 [Patescibacteria group bacterium]|nr:MAG: hypothetical protein KatS3mg087_0080 [Patescibacteria group bacterium]